MPQNSLSQISHDFLTPHRRYQAIIFDLAGVLVRWQPHILMQEAALPEDHPLPPVEKIVSSDAWLAFDRGMISQKLLLHALVAQTKINEGLIKRFLHAFPPHLRPIGVGVAMLRMVKQRGYKVYALSNMPQPALTYMEEHHDFFKLFDGIVASCSVGLIKPEPTIYHYLLSTFNLDPASCLFIDDTAKNVIAAHEEGIDSIICDNHERVSALLDRLTK